MKAVPTGRRMKMPPPPVEEDNDEFSEDESDDDFDEEEDEDEEEGCEDIGGLMIELLSHEGDNVCSAMIKVAKQLETTNRLLVKMLTASHYPPPTPKKERRRRHVEPELEQEAVDLTNEDDENDSSAEA